RVVRADIVEHSRQKPRECDRGGQTAAYSDQSKLESASIYYSQNLWAAGAQRHSYSHLVSPLGHRIGHHAIDAYRGHNQRERSERPEQHQGESLFSDRGCDDFLNGADVEDGHISVNIADPLLYGCDETGRVGRCSRHEG